MRNEQFVFGKDLPPWDRDKITGNIDKIKEAAKQKIDGEYEKTPEELKFIAISDDYLRQEFYELNIPDFKELDPNGFHFLDKEAYYKLHDDSFLAFVRSMERAAYFNKDRMRNRMEFYKTILHEAIHIVSAEKNQVFQKKDGRHISDYRVGYRNIANIEDGYSIEHEHFRGLNEGVTDLVVLDIFNKHKDELISELKITDEEQSMPVTFTDYKDLIKNIIDKTAQKQGRSYDDVWRNFKRGVFTGEMMHLREVERTFGKGALRFLAAVFSGTKDNESGDIDKKIFRYFDIDDEKEREEIADEVLNEREKVAYQKRRSKDHAEPIWRFES